MRRIGILIAAFAAMVAGIEGLRTALAWWKGELAHIGWTDALLLGCLPLAAALWWRYLSIFGRKNPKCLSTDE
ncbi:MAG: hypothetical protein COW56_01105 [Rhodocyclales bacterium CG17_big_fil_post_rev_8_21_14_2_50_68_7]|nr:MAG: hypothetical protein COW56_01105 [Rhodocyclales bacterium CG17_big_fil_post_rev_8_21_14_2_50_68_7]PIX75471.1 MAG: hypothetical protein COZ38_05375 [Rhodocyclales bacterium CG_4_10_14_3_um_filter_68_10]